MKNYSTIPPQLTPVKWKKGEWAIFANIQENTDIVEEDSGQRYISDMTVITELTAEAAIQAFTRQQQDPELDYAAINTIQVEGKNALEIVKEYPVKASSTIFPALPESGYLEEGVIYSYNNGAVMVRQSHERTIYAPELTPALFTFYRENKEGQEWIPQEPVELNNTRTYQGKIYKCIQPHVTQSDWTPLLTTGVMWEEVLGQQELPPQWNTANWVQYIVGYRVVDSGKIWEAINTTHTWIQPALTGDGAISWKFIADV